ncbi:MAG: phage integrase SAM-like domain-containing protein, partial [SAR324 cluster bacterium]|nr:phage integrase SAM-like domain-containing protein [SAR324 cluster bacterium]
MKSLTVDDIKQILREKLQKAKRHAEWTHSGTNIWDEEKVAKVLGNINHYEQVLKDRLKHDFKSVEQEIDDEIKEIISEGEFEQIDSRSQEYRLLHKNLIDLKLKTFQMKRDMFENPEKSEWSMLDSVETELDSSSVTSLDSTLMIEEKIRQKETQTASEEFNQQEIPSEKTPTPYSGNYPLQKVINKFIEDKTQDLGKHSKTVMDYRSTLRTFVEIHGNIQISEVTREHARKFKEIIMQLPPNRYKIKEFKGKSIVEILEIAKLKYKPMALNTVNNQLTMLVAFFNWGVREGFFSRNFAEGLKIPKKRKLSSERKRFKLEELKKVFNADDYLSETSEGKPNAR